MSHLGCSNCQCSITQHDPSLNLRPQKPRTTFTQEQLALLEQMFHDSNYPNTEKRQSLAKILCLPDERVRVWFQNRRAKEKRLTEEKLALSLKPKERQYQPIFSQLDARHILNQPLPIPSFFARQPAPLQPMKMVHSHKSPCQIENQPEPENYKEASDTSLPKSEEEVIRLLLKKAKEKEQGKYRASGNEKRKRR